MLNVSSRRQVSPWWFQSPPSCRGRHLSWQLHQQSVDKQYRQALPQRFTPVAPPFRSPFCNGPRSRLEASAQSCGFCLFWWRQNQTTSYLEGQQGPAASADCCAQQVAQPSGGWRRMLRLFASCPQLAAFSSSSSSAWPGLEEPLRTGFSHSLPGQLKALALAPGSPTCLWNGRRFRGLRVEQREDGGECSDPDLQLPSKRSKGSGSIRETSAREIELTGVDFGVLKSTHTRGLQKVKEIGC